MAWAPRRAASTVSGVAPLAKMKPRYLNKFALAQNHPNPFNPTTTIRYDLPKDSKVVLKIYNILGQEVRTLVNTTETFGRKSVVWDGKNDLGNPVSSGVYVYRIETADFVKSHFFKFRIGDPDIQTSTSKCFRQFPGSVACKYYIRLTFGFDGSNFGYSDLPVRQQFKKKALELLIGPVYFINQ